MAEEPFFPHDAPFPDQDTDTELDAGQDAEFLDLVGFNESSGFETFFSDVQSTNLFYTEYHICTLLETNMGVEIMPVAARTGAARVVRLHAPYSIKTIVWEAERRGGIEDRPVLPHWDTGDSNDVLAFSFFAVHAPPVQPGGTRLGWSVRGWYKYLMYATLEESEILQVAALPTHNLAVDRLNAQGFTFSRDILKTVSPAGYTDAVKSLSDE